MINKEEFEKASFEENQRFIKKILSLATHNAFTKDDLLFLLKWQSELIEKMKCCANCKHQDYSEVEYCYKCSREYAGADTKDNWELKE